MRRKFEEWGLLETDIKRRDFMRNVTYYKEQMENEANLNNKYCFIMPYMRGHMGKNESSYMEKVEDFIEEYEC